MGITLEKIFFNSIVVAVVATMLFSCGNPIEKIEEVSVKDTLPIEQARDITMYYSDSGIIKARMTAPFMKRYESKEQKGILKLPQGLKVVFFDSLGKQETVLTAKYGERFDELQRIEVKYDVLVLTADSKRLISDHLIWDERQKKIFSNEFVKIITPDKVIWGDGFESDERFDQYKILRPKGEFEIKDDKKTE